MTEQEFFASDYFVYYAYAVVIVFSLALGSFFNVVILRLPKQMQQQWVRDCCELMDQPVPEQTPTGIVFPNSHCPKCKAPIKPWHNIPVLSFLVLKGRCASCRAPISPRYPIIELATALLSVVVVNQLGFNWTGLSGLIFTWALINLTVIDFDTQLLPDSITLPLLWLGLIVNHFGLFTDLPSALWGAVFGYLSLWSIFWLFKILTGKEGMGYGDFKLLAALGAWMGWQMLPLIVILSSFVGAFIGIALILVKGRDKNIPIPFGPYLAIAGWIAMLWGDKITHSYLQFAHIG